MKKIIITLSLFIILIPSVASAAWWNPGSWFGNWSFLRKREIKTEILERKIQELENKLQNITSTDDAKIDTTPISEKTEVIVPVTDKEAIIKTQEKMYTDLKVNETQNALIIKKKVEEQAKIEAAKVELNRQAAQLATQLQAEQLVIQAKQKAEEQAKIDEAKAELERQRSIQQQIEQQAIQAKQQKLDEDRVRIDAMKAESDRQTALLLVQEAARQADLQAKQQETQRVADQLATERALQAQQEKEKLQIKQQKVNEINQQIVNLNARYVTDIAAARERTASMTTINSLIRRITEEYNLDYAALQVQYQQIQYSN